MADVPRRQFPGRPRDVPRAPSDIYALCLATTLYMAAPTGKCTGIKAPEVWPAEGLGGVVGTGVGELARYNLYRVFVAALIRGS